MGRMIDADALIAQMEADAEQMEDQIAKMFTYAAINDVKHAPTIEERKTGMWVKLNAHRHLADHKCTACGQECYVPTCMGEPMYAYCPNCGAKMEGDKDSV